MKKSLEKFEGKVVQFRLKSSCLVADPNRYKWPDTGIVKIKRDNIFFAQGIKELRIFSGKNAELDWSFYEVDMRTVKELSKVESLIWKLEHNM